MKTFLSPLTTEEEKMLLQQMADGDLEAKASLIEHNMRLVAHVAKKYYSPNEDSGRFIIHWDNWTIKSS